MRRIRLTVAYDGTNYVGWQTQPNGVAIEDVLKGALRRLLSEDVELIGASRTDSGVHADGNVAVFDTEARMPADKFRFALNEFLPDDIVIRDSDEVPLSWHPRKRNSVKTYEYRILNSVLPLPKERNYAYFYYYPLDAGKMDRAAKTLLGEHDFRSFCSIRTDVEDYVRRIYDIGVTRTGDIITLRISGNGFLYNMVRIIAGTLVKIGAGLFPEDCMAEILEARDRAKAGPKAPARGLTLLGICDRPGIPENITETNPHWSYTLCYDRIEQDGTGYAKIERCDEEDFPALLLRLTKNLSRNGAGEIEVEDAAGRLKDGLKASYFTFYEVSGRFVTRDEKKTREEAKDSAKKERPGV